MIKDCSATGSVTGKKNVGGLVGTFPQEQKPQVRQGVMLVGNSSAAVLVSGSQNVGGLVGGNSGNITKDHGDGFIGWEL